MSEWIFFRTEKYSMPNKTAASEWLLLAEHDSTAAEILYKAEHYSDTISFLLQQALEKGLKSLLAYQNRKIKKSHDLMEIYSEINSLVSFSETELDILDIATSYYVENRYPHSNYSLPEKSEIEMILRGSHSIFQKIRKVIL